MHCPVLSKERHNKGTRMCLSAVAVGELGSGLVAADVGQDEELDDALAGRCLMKRTRLKRWFFGSNHAATASCRSVPDAVLVIPCGPHEGPARCIPRRNRKLMLIEVKYCSDTRYAEKLQLNMRTCKPPSNPTATQWRWCPSCWAHQVYFTQSTHDRCWRSWVCGQTQATD